MERQPIGFKVNGDNRAQDTNSGRSKFGYEQPVNEEKSDDKLEEICEIPVKEPQLITPSLDDNSGDLRLISITLFAISWAILIVVFLIFGPR